MENLCKMVFTNLTFLPSLPVDFGELASLRHLNLSGCTNLTGLPKSFSKLGIVKKLMKVYDLDSCFMFLVFYYSQLPIMTPINISKIFCFTGTWLCRGSTTNYFASFTAMGRVWTPIIFLSKFDLRLWANTRQS